MLRQRSRTAAGTPTSSEAGSANLLGFIFALIILIPAFFVFLHLNGAKTARTQMNWQAINTAKAAASATYTTPEGELRVDLTAGAAKARAAYQAYRFNNRDHIGSLLMSEEVPVTVTVACTPLGTMPDGGCTEVDVDITDTYDGTFLTHDLVPAFAMQASTTAALVFAEDNPRAR